MAEEPSHTKDDPDPSGASAYRVYPGWMVLILLCAEIVSVRAQSADVIREDHARLVAAVREQLPDSDQRRLLILMLGDAADAALRRVDGIGVRH
jgi:hypothetical protein